jgi:polysaccharide deacetylase 2 family uncharacterized protein YibQ
MRRARQRWLIARTKSLTTSVRMHLFTARFVLVLLALGVSFGSIAGCKKTEQSLPVARIHAITQEFASAAKSAAPADSQIRVAFRAAGGTDHVDVTTFSHNREISSRAVSARIVRALNGVAVPAGLTQDAPSENRDGLVVVYRRSGAPIITVALHFNPPAAEAAGALPQHGSSSTQRTSGPGKLAILLDDLGSDRAAADQIFALPYPLTISVLPEHAHSVEIAQEATRRGYEVMLHLPMQSVGKEQPEPQELQSGMPVAQVSALVDQFLRELPGVTGVNNHQGSLATSDPALMEELMPLLREHRLFYVDSRTTAATVAYDAARQDGVPAGFRNVPFLDDVENKTAIEKQIALALRGAREKGEAIAIGHPHPVTLQALREMLPKAKAEGVTLVFVSELVH